MIETAVSIPVNVAAKLMGMSVVSMQGCLQNKALPIGGAWKNVNSTCWMYYISPKQFSDYTGIPMTELRRLIEK